MKEGFRQSMAWLHTWAGLTLGWVLYFMFLTGTAGYFDTEIDRWMQPERPPAQIGAPAQAAASIAVERLQAQAPDAPRWFIGLPVDRNVPWLRTFRPGGDSELLDVRTGEPLAGRDTGGGQLLYRMHWRLHYLPRVASDWLIGLATLFMLVAIITGVIIHKKIFKDFFTFRPGKGQRSWLDAHNALSVLALPFHLMITYSGLVFMGFIYMPLIVAAHYGPDGRQDFIDEVFSPPGMAEAAGEAAPMAPLAPMIASAEARWGADSLYGIEVFNPNDRNARVVLRQSHMRDPLRSGERLIFDGAGGALLAVEPRRTSAAKTTRDALVGLHEGMFAPPVLRWLYFLSGVAGTAMIGTGLVLWTRKRRERAARQPDGGHRGLALVERLNVGTVAGLPVAVAAYFWANRLIPAGLPGRAEWEVHAMFLTWLALLLHAALRPPRRAWRAQFTLAAAAWALLPVLNAVTSERHLGYSLPAADWAVAGFDLTALAIGVAFAWAAWRSAVRSGQTTARRRAVPAPDIPQPHARR